MVRFSKARYTTCFCNDKEVLVFVDDEEIGNLYRDEKMDGWAASGAVEAHYGVEFSDGANLNSLKKEISDFDKWQNE